VAEEYELEIEYWARPYPTHGDAHPCPCVTIPDGLWAVVLFADQDGRGG
jgi:hypothetical protein